MYRNKTNKSNQTKRKSIVRLASFSMAISILSSLNMSLSYADEQLIGISQEGPVNDMGKVSKTTEAPTSMAQETSGQASSIQESANAAATIPETANVTSTIPETSNTAMATQETASSAAATQEAVTSATTTQEAASSTVITQETASSATTTQETTTSETSVPTNGALIQSEGTNVDITNVNIAAIPESAAQSTEGMPGNAAGINQNDTSKSIGEGMGTIVENTDTGNGTTGTTDTASSAIALSTGTSDVNLAKVVRDGNTKDIGSLVDSEFAIIYDLDNSRIIAEKNADAVIYPASMTKIMTILLCGELLKDANLEEKLTITQDIQDYIYARDASNCGYAVGEQASIKDLLYGIVLPSGADAVMAVTRKVAGSDSGFVQLMNQKAQELGLSQQAHFDNATGLYAATHHLTVKDMAEILNAAMKNPIARQVLMAPSYKTSSSSHHSKGIQFTNLFLQRSAQENTGGIAVQAAKTGYISQSRSCAASYGTSPSGRHFIVVTGKASSAWQCVHDHSALYRTYAATAS